MRSTHHTSVTLPIPANLPPDFVLNYLQTFTPSLAANPLVVHFEEVRSDLEAIANDPLFDTKDETIRSYEARSVVQLMPGVSREFKFPSIFQQTSDGIVSRGTAPPQIIVWAQWRIRPRQDSASQSPISDDTPTSDQTLGQDWELHEDITIESNTLFMPFVMFNTVSAHREICWRFLQDATKVFIMQKD